MVDAFRHFLASTKELTEYFKPGFHNFLNLYCDLLKIKCRQSKESPSFIKKKIEAEKELINKQWLLNKADELIPKSKK